MNGLYIPLSTTAVLALTYWAGCWLGALARAIQDARNHDHRQE